MVKLGRRFFSWSLILFSVAVVAALIIGALAQQISARTSQFFAAVNSGAIWPTQLTHEQTVWLSALEWCESSGSRTVVNKKDVDGTPSYYSFQFKPTTFKIYGIRYGLFSPDISDEAAEAQLDNYALQKKMVTLMLRDPRVVWRREFPDCVRRLGLPPRAS